MRPLKSVLLELNDLDIRIWIENGKLHVNAPKGVLSDTLKLELSNRKNEIIVYFQQLNLDAKANLPLIQSVDRSHNLPLSYAQQRLWFLEQYEPGSSLYHIPSVMRLRGELNLKALIKSFNTIIERHESLRTAFDTADGKPFQKIQEKQIIDLPLTDLSRKSLDHQKVEIKHLLSAETQNPFDFTSDIMLRARLIKLKSNEHILIIVMHHIASDGWSMGIFWKELSALYNAYSQDEPSPLPDLPVQYADFTIWQRDWLQGEVLDDQLSYWKKQLDGAPKILELPTDHPRPRIQTHKGAHLSFTLTEELTLALKELSRQEGVTLFMTLLSAFKILLFRYTNQQDILVGAPIANRNQPEIEDLIGFFVNTLVIRSDLSGNPTFKDLLKKVKEVCLDAYAHQDLPFEKLVEEIQPQRNISHSPLFQVMFGLQNRSKQDLHLTNLTLKPEKLSSNSSKFNLSLNITEGDKRLSGGIQYNSDLFETLTIQRMAGHFLILLEGIVLNPDQTISMLPILTQKEKNQLLVEFNNNYADYPKNKCLHQLFESQVQKTPEAIAVTFNQYQLNYRHLNMRANQLAHSLMNKGIGPEVLVGICVERSLELVIGLLGILKAGGAYIPLDSDYPNDRLNFILEDSNVSILLTQEKLKSNFQVKNNNKYIIICLDSEWGKISKEQSNNPDNNVTSKNIAYGIYTSGSTGKPKGVLIPHKSICNHMFWMQQKFPLNGLDKVLQKTSYSFDASIWEFFAPLMTGAQIILAQPKGHQNPNYLVNAIIDNQITCIKFVPSMLQQMLEEDKFKACKSLRHVFCGGEELNATLKNQFFLKKLEAELHNLYGPTEASVNTLHLTCRNDNKLDVVPIGRPNANTQAFILDPYLTQVPLGIHGELYIGGKGLARGYLNRPELTAKKFISNPFSQEPGALLYRTGDRARFLPDGNIEFLGRFDHQVKIRGYRIELGEIESVLQKNESVNRAVVIAREDRTNDKRIVAYVVSKPGIQPAINELRGYLKEKLPAYMIPSFFIFIDEVPLMANGKINRKALPEPDLSRPELEEKFVPPSSPVEIFLVDLWTDLIRIDSIGIHDNFFDLGGHSLLATQVISRIQKSYQIIIPVRALFESPTIAELSLIINKTKQKANYIELKSYPNKKDIPLSYAQQRLWFLEQYEPGSSLYHIPSAKRLKGDLDIKALEKSFQTIIDRHEALRTTFDTIDGKPFQHIQENQIINLPLTDLSSKSLDNQKEKIKHLIADEAHRSFDFSSDIMLRAHLIKLEPKEHILIIVMHHIASDGWSMGILWKELSSLYNAYSQNKTSPLPDLPVQYTDFTIWQQEWFQGDVLGDQLSYWKEHLDDVPTILEFPTDHPRPAVQTHNGAYLSFTIPEEIALGLKELSKQEGVTLFMTLLSAFKILLFRYTNQEDILVGTPIANRNQAEIEDLIGFFVNTLVIRSNLSGNPTFKELLKNIKEVCLAAYANQDLPFEKLVEEIQPQRNISHSPLFQVMFGLQNTSKQDLHLTNLTLKPEKLSGNSSKFDLSLNITEGDKRLSGGIQYNSDLFEPSTIQRMAGHFLILLEGIVSNIDQVISVLPILTQKEKHQLLVELNKTQANYPDDLCIHQLFEQWANQTPDETAIVFENQYISYKDLNIRSNQLAHYLIEQGVVPEATIAICMERSLEMIIVMLGILKAGGTYVPLDPTFPKDLLSILLEDSNPRLLLVEEKFKYQLPDLNMPVYYWNKLWDGLEQYACDNPDIKTSNKNLAYIFYTSGSTGMPKGVMISHLNVVFFLFSYKKVTQDGPRRIGTSVAPFNFDTSVEEIFSNLCFGGTLHIIRPDNFTNVEYFANYLVEHKITTTYIGPDFLSGVASHLSKERNRINLKCLITGLSPKKESVLQKFRSISNDIRILNAYGPTEVTYGATAYNFHNTKNPDRDVPIGMPFPNYEVYIVDNHLQPVPVGIAGELLIGGKGLARGYLNQPALTEEKFIPHPFSKKPGVRLYRTGDRVRFLPDGNIEFLGRFDHQVKIRGYRIELGEIESVLQKNESVNRAVVIAREDRTNDKRIVAYVVSKPGIQPAINELRGYLKEKLPAYMIPSFFIFIDEVPLMANGKINRKALPEPDLSRPELEEKFVPASSPVEIFLVDLWTDLIRIDSIGIHDNFFDLGGHSLLATQVIARIQKFYQIIIPVRALFESPTIAELALIIDKAKQNTNSTALKPYPHKENIPLSFAQQRLLFLEQYEPGSSLYHIPSAIRLKGDLNIKALEKSFHTIIDRHESLRTTFDTIDGKPFQKIQEIQITDLPLTDLSSKSLDNQKEEIKHLLTDTTQKPFDFSSDIMLRTHLIKLKPKEHLLVIVIHHIASDGWSTGILWKELSALYNAYNKGEPSPLPDLPVQYTDFTIWQREWLQGDVLDKQLSYWKKQLDGAPEILELPTDHPRPPIQTHKGAHLSYTLTEELTLAINELCKQEGVTLFMTLLSAFKVLLYRYTNQKDILVGTPIANRNQVEIEGLIGFFVNTLVLRSDLSDNPTFKKLLENTKEVCLDAYVHQDLPFEKLVEELQPKRNLSYSPLFQVGFALQNTPSPSDAFSGLILEKIDTQTVTTKFDLSLSITENPNSLTCTIVYSQKLFNVKTIDRMIKHFQILLKGIVKNPNGSIEKLPILTETEKKQILVDWNNTKVEYPENEFAHTLFEAAVEKHPKAVAIQFEDQKLTYQDLNIRANQLAHFLKKRGVGPEIMVGFYLERSPAILIVILGIIKAGGVYVPIDPNYPQDRVSFMIEDSNILFLITQEKLLDTLPSNCTTIICLDLCETDLDQESKSNPLPEINGENSVYVIYTSGTTGKPKGVVVKHQGLYNLIKADREYFKVGINSRVLHFVSFCFDAATIHFFRAFCSCATLCLTSEGLFSLKNGLLEFLSIHKITHASLPASLLASLTPEHLPSLRVLSVGAETCTAELVTQWAKGRRFLNCYGPTEATILSTIMECHDTGKNPPIGRPISNTKIYILDKHLQPVPEGFSGELHIGGIGVARGYLNRLELTKEKFINNPFDDETGSRLYKTGDLARYLPDGNIEFIGRIDHQVKIRGFRIELEEIDSILRKHSTIEESVVTVYEDQTNDKRLIAYLVPKENLNISTVTLRQFMKKKLPEHMIPSAFVLLETLPLTVNGKIDRDALPEPDLSNPERDIEFKNPQTRLELVIAEVWQDLLGIEQIGVYDNFFDIGGHSLLLMQVIAKLEKKTGIRLNPKDFMFQTLGQISVIYEEKIESSKNIKNKNFIKKLKQLIKNKLFRNH